ncbi:hypothetical protein BTH55_05935 [Lactobacillus delbrueckii subsp. bulgaricus]|nr:hypothetical protein [Lactobacillus delbrueckii subsp. bulgaricus]MBT8865279.1 hypothetical protein [Lactobacillus delbrueckii subsp. bulgaricus]MBT8866705.1 hypothetical protein [Lactobacillus delbrueckii subsp. bulgaricus]MBT8874819.1 hypothetical protein [Lactobacillus delbrueckii subsp. bulgaricus]MBT8879682.1 hypothetical protein [Lactobacillus delbrueckii subsp. bulgaricus]
MKLNQLNNKEKESRQPGFFFYCFLNILLVTTIFLKKEKARPSRAKKILLTNKSKGKFCQQLFF